MFVPIFSFILSIHTAFLQICGNYTTSIRQVIVNGKKITWIHHTHSYIYPNPIHLCDKLRISTKSFWTCGCDASLPPTLSVRINFDVLISKEIDEFLAWIRNRRIPQKYKRSTFVKLTLSWFYLPNLSDGKPESFLLYEHDDDIREQQIHKKIYDSISLLASILRIIVFEKCDEYEISN